MSKSEERKRRHVVAVRLDDDERAELERLANSYGLSLSDFTRSVLLERTPLGMTARTRIPTGAEVALATIVQRLGDHTAEVNKIGSNINQLAHNSNAGYAVPAAKLGRAASELERHNDLLEDIRDAVFTALGVHRLPTRNRE